MRFRPPVARFRSQMPCAPVPEGAAGEGGVFIVAYGCILAKETKPLPNHTAVLYTALADLAMSAAGVRRPQHAGTTGMQMQRAFELVKKTKSWVVNVRR